MFCPKCGADAGNVKFCPECGAPIADKKKSAIDDVANQFSVDGDVNKPVRRKKSLLKRWWFWAAIVIALVIVSSLGGNDAGTTSPSPDVTDDSASDTLESASSEELLAFDEQTWPQFIELYNAHNTLVNNIQAVADGNASLVDLYQYCEDAKAYFGEKSLSFNYGESDYQKDYLQVFESMAFYDHMAVEKLMDYLDSFETSDISAASDYISKAVTAMKLIASNRGTLLAATDLTDEEIQQRIEDSTAGLQ